jgi:phosphoglucomutase
MRVDDNGAAIGGLKVVTAHDWFSARPSGEAVQALRQKLSWQEEAQALINRAARKDAKHLLSQVEGGRQVGRTEKNIFF